MLSGTLYCVVAGTLGCISPGIRDRAFHSGLLDLDGQNNASVIDALVAEGHFLTFSDGTLDCLGQLLTAKFHRFREGN